MRTKGRAAGTASPDRASFELWSRGAESVRDRDYAKLLKRVIDGSLSEKQREYLTLYYFGNRSMPQIAEMYGVRESTVSRTVARAKRRIENVMKYLVRS